MVRELVALYLEKMGYNVLEAKNGREAIDLLGKEEEDKFELIVTDLMMPEVGGAEVIRKARETGKCDRILIISGYTDDVASLENAIKEGSGFLKKPFTFNDFEAKIADLKERIS